MAIQNNHDIVEVLHFCQQNNVPARVVGKWVWVKYSGNPGSSVRQLLKDFGFRWSKRRKQWAHNCGNHSKPADNYAPWDRYETIKADEYLASH